MAGLKLNAFHELLYLILTKSCHVYFVTILLQMRELRLSKVTKLAPKSHNFWGFKLVLFDPYTHHPN